MWHQLLPHDFAKPKSLQKLKTQLQSQIIHVSRSQQSFILSIVSTKNKKEPIILESLSSLCQTQPQSLFLMITDFKSSFTNANFEKEVIMSMVVKLEIWLKKSNEIWGVWTWEESLKPFEPRVKNSYFCCETLVLASGSQTPAPQISWLTLFYLYIVYSEFCQVQVRVQVNKF